MNFPYNHYSTYLKKKYNERIQKITVIGGFTCPNRDGTLGNTGCTYCNNKTFAAPEHLTDKSITFQIDHGIRTSKRRYKKVNKYFVYFQQYSNTYAPVEKLKELYSEALQHPEVIGLSIGTRPDCVDEEKLDYIGELAREYDITIEYGMESVFDATLDKINRGHNFETFKDAVIQTAKRGISVCVHLIIGFPWETKEDLITTAREISKLPIGFIKIHQLHVVKDTEMAKEYAEKPFELYSKSEYMDALIALLENMDEKIVIQRLYGESPKEMTIAPDWHMAQAEFVEELVKEMERRNTYQGKNASYSISNK